MATVLVDTYLGFKGEDTPRAFSYEGTFHRVKEIVSQWYTQEHSYFRVHADDGFRYILRNDLNQLSWELVMREDG